MEEPTVSELVHKDWLLRSIQSCVCEVNSDIPTEIFYMGKDECLKISDVSEEDIMKLYFITNTDKNNNTLTLIKFDVFLKGQISPLFFPGLTQVVQRIYNSKDSDSFLRDKKTFVLFDGAFIEPTTTISEFIDNTTDMVKCLPKTRDLIKTYN
jgi:hypothetical protein